MAEPKVTITPNENALTLDHGDTETETIIVEVGSGTPIVNVKLVPTGATAPFVTSINPAGGYGPLAPNQEHKLKFEVTFIGVVPCQDKEQVLTGTIDVVVTTERGERVVDRKQVRITVPACDQRPQLFSYSVKFVCGVQDDCACSCAPVRPGRTRPRSMSITSIRSRRRFERSWSRWCSRALPSDENPAGAKSGDPTRSPSRLGPPQWTTVAESPDCCSAQNQRRRSR